jgi:hypothetical protein
MLKCLYVTNNQLDVNLPMLIRLQESVRFKQSRSKHPHKTKDTLVVIKQEKERQKIKRKEKDLGQDDSNIRKKSRKDFQNPLQSFHSFKQTRRKQQITSKS